MNFESGDPQAAEAVRPNANVLFKRLGDEIILFHLDTDRFYELNGTAARFWELLAAGEDAAGVRRQMLKEFSVESNEFDREAKTFLASLKKESLVVADEKSGF
jgi:hypothetical protein